jgi:Cysteine dioxygenase type I
VWLICWDIGQDTLLHDHGGSVGAFAVARGSLLLDEQGDEQPTSCAPPCAAQAVPEAYARVLQVQIAGESWTPLDTAATAGRGVASAHDRAHSPVLD